jgi:hypothetical protein
MNSCSSSFSLVSGHSDGREKCTTHAVHGLHQRLTCLGTRAAQDRAGPGETEARHSSGRSPSAGRPRSSLSLLDPDGTPAEYSPFASLAWMCFHPGWWWAICDDHLWQLFPSPMSSEGPRRGRESHARGWDAGTGAGGTSLLDRDPRLMAGPGPRRELVQRRLDALTSDFGHYVYAYDDRVSFTGSSLNRVGSGGLEPVG